MIAIPLHGSSGCRVDGRRRFVHRFACEQWGKTRRKFFAEFNAPLIETVDSPDNTLYIHEVFVHCDELTEYTRC